jgi:hypothetical protein
LLPAVGSAQDMIAGIWRGESKCVQKESACHDETVVYRFSPLREKRRMEVFSGAWRCINSENSLGLTGRSRLLRIFRVSR